MPEHPELSDLHYDFAYRETVVVDDGTEVVLRLLRPDDRERLERGFDHLSDESKYRRFLGPKSQLSERELEYLVDIDQLDHVALAAEPADHDDEPHEAGLARCVRLSDEPEVAEAAVTVVDAYQGKGLGRTLLDRLVEAARERGITTFRATLFAQNEPMQTLLQEIGDARVVERDGPVVTLGIALDRAKAEPEAPDADSERESTTLERILALTGRGAASLVDKFTRGSKAAGATEADDSNSVDRGSDQSQ